MSQQPEAVRTVEIRRWILLALLIVAGIINYADRQIISLLKPVISADLHWTDADYGRLGAVFQVAAALGFLVSGWLVDRLPVKWINPVGIAAWSVAAAAHGVVSSFGQFFIARAALGATESIGTPASIKTLSSLFPPAQRSTAIGVSNAAGTIGAMLTPVLIPGVALEVGWRGAFIVLGVIGLIWTIPWLLASRGLAADRGSAIGAASAPSYFAIARDRRTWAIAGAKALSDQVWWLLLFWTPDFLHRSFHLTPMQMGAPLAVIYLGSAVGSGFWGWLASWLLSRGYSVNRVRKGVLLACALIALPIPLAAHTGDYWVAVALLSLTLSAHQGFSVNLFSTIGDIIPAGRVGSVTSIGAFCGNLAGAFVVFIAGETLSRGGDYGPLLAFAGVSYLLGVAWLQMLLPRLTPISAPGL